MSKIELYLSGNLSKRVLGRKPTPLEELVHRCSKRINRCKKAIYAVDRPLRLTASDYEDVSDRYQEALEYQWYIREQRDTIEVAEEVSRQLIAFALSAKKHNTTSFKDFTCKFYKCVDCKGEFDILPIHTLEEFYQRVLEETKSREPKYNSAQVVSSHNRCADIKQFI